MKFLFLAEMYLLTAKNIFEKINESHNMNINIYDKKEDPKNYYKFSNWDDIHTLIPALFLFFHGLELLLKGLLYEKNIEFKANHKIDFLFESIKTEYKEKKLLIEILENYINKRKLNSVIIDQFIELNPDFSDTTDLYLALRYPAKKDMISKYNFDALLNRGILSTWCAKEISDDIISVLKEIQEI